MAGLLSWLGNTAHRVAHDVNNDVINPVRRDVINPVAHAGGNVVHAVETAPSVVNRDVVRPVFNAPQTFRNDVIAPVQRDVVRPLFNAPQTINNDLFKPITRIPLGNGVTTGGFVSQLPHALEDVAKATPLASVRAAEGLGQSLVDTPAFAYNSADWIANKVNGTQGIQLPGQSALNTATNYVNKPFEYLGKRTDQAAQNAGLNMDAYHAAQVPANIAATLVNPKSVVNDVKKVGELAATNLSKDAREVALHNKLVQNNAQYRNFAKQAQTMDHYTALAKAQNRDPKLINSYINKANTAKSNMAMIRSRARQTGAVGKNVAGELGPKKPSVAPEVQSDMGKMFYHGTSNPDIKTLADLQAGSKVGGSSRNRVYVTENPEIAKNFGSNVVSNKLYGKHLNTRDIGVEHTPGWAADNTVAPEFADYKTTKLLTDREKRVFENSFVKGIPDNTIIEDTPGIHKYLASKGYTTITVPRVHSDVTGPRTETIIIDPKAHIAPQPTQAAKPSIRPQTDRTAAAQPSTPETQRLTSLQSSLGASLSHGAEQPTTLPRSEQAPLEKPVQTRSLTSTRLDKTRSRSFADNSTTVNPKSQPSSPQSIGKALGMTDKQIAQGMKEGNPSEPSIVPKDRTIGNITRNSATKVRNQRVKGPVEAKDNTILNEHLSKTPPPSVKLPDLHKESGDLPPVSQLPTKNVLFSSKLQLLRKTGTKAGNELADRIENTDRQSADLQTKWMNSIPTVHSLNKDETAQMFDVVERKIKAGSVSPKVKQAAKEWRKLAADVYKTTHDLGIPVGERQNYVPHHYDLKAIKHNGSKYDSMLQYLMDTGQIKHNEAVKLFKDMSTDNARRPNRFGHLESARLTEAPGYEQSKQVLYNYIHGAAQRTAEAQNLGLDNRIAGRLLTNLRQEGGDADTAAKVVENYLRSQDKGRGAPTLRNVRGAFGFARLSKAALSHAGQTSNTAVDAGVANTIKAWGHFIANNKENKAFIDKTGVILPQNLHHYEQQYTSVRGLMSRATAPGLETMLKINRSVTALAYKNYADHLVEAGNVSELRKLGVTGDIGKQLTEHQQIQAARGGVERTMFGGSRATTPLYAETRIGKTIGQYRTAYAYPQTKFIYDRVVKEARNGNLKPLARYLTVSAGIGAGTVAIKNKISGHQEGPGGIAADTIGALGGLPGELLVSGARYGKNDVGSTIASSIAPLAGEFLNLADGATKALQGKPQSLERYGMKLVPGVGSRLSSTLVPYTKTITSGSTKVTLKNNQIDDYMKVHDQLGKPVIKQLTSDPSFKNLSKSGQTKALNSLKSDITKAAERTYSSKNGIGMYAQNYTGKDTPPTARLKAVLSGKIDPSVYTIGHSSGTSRSSQKGKAGTTITKNGQLYHYSATGRLVKGAPPVPKATSSSSTTTYDPKTNTWTRTTLSTGKTVRIAKDGTQTIVSPGIGHITHARSDYTTNIVTLAKKYNVDPYAALSVAAMEGLGGGVGDNGTSFGPFQLHVGGELPLGKTQAWAESPAGINYALQRISKVAGGLKGQQAIEAIVNSFEKPADPNSEIAGALSLYSGKNVTVTPGSPRSYKIAGAKSRTGVYSTPAGAKLKFELARKPLKIVGSLPAPKQISAPKFTTPGLRTVYQKKAVNTHPAVSVTKTRHP